MAKRILRELKLDKIAAVDFPCQEGALMTIMKRNSAPKIDAEQIAKSIYGSISSNDQPTGAQSFADLIAAQEEQQRQCEVSQELWPYFDALTNSLRSIVADTSLDEAGKINAMRQSIDQFTEAVTAAVPDAEAEIEKIFTNPASSGVFSAGSPGFTDNKGESDMSDLEKKVSDLTSQVADLTKRAEKAEADLAKANTDLTAEKAKVDEMTKAAEIAKNDETFSADGVTIRKSEVGESSFKFMKAQQERIELAEMQKRAETEIGHLPGEPIAKAKALKAIAKMSDEDKATLDTMLKAGEAAVAKGFTTFGVKPGAPASDDPIAKLDGMAKARAAKDSIPYAKAYDEVLKTSEGQELYAASQKAA
jgi:hypothetical protein